MHVIPFTPRARRRSKAQRPGPIILYIIPRGNRRPNRSGYTLYAAKIPIYLHIDFYILLLRIYYTIIISIFSRFYYFRG